MDRINVSIADGTWLEYKEQLKLRDRGTVTLKEFSETYIEEYAKVRNKKKSWLRKQTSLNVLNTHMGTLDLNAISPSYLHSYVRKRKRQGLSEGTINKDLNTIRHLLSYAEECGVIKSNPLAQFRNLKEEQKERLRFTDEQVDAVINAVRPDCRPYIFSSAKQGADVRKLYR